MLCTSVSQDAVLIKQNSNQIKHSSTNMKLVPSFAFALLLVLFDPVAVAARSSDPCKCGGGYCDQTALTMTDCPKGPKCGGGYCIQT